MLPIACILLSYKGTPCNSGCLGIKVLGYGYHGYSGDPSYIYLREYSSEPTTASLLYTSRHPYISPVYYVYMILCTPDNS